MSKKYQASLSKPYLSKTCLTCVHFVSFRDDYFDELEPDNQGFCKHPTNKHFDGAGFNFVCEDHTPMDQSDVNLNTYDVWGMEVWRNGSATDC